MSAAIAAAISMSFDAAAYFYSPLAVFFFSFAAPFIFAAITRSPIFRHRSSPFIFGSAAPMPSMFAMSLPMRCCQLTPPREVFQRRHATLMP